MNTHLILEYFDVIFKIVDNVPKIKLKLKESKKNGNLPIFKSKFIPYSGAHLKYYTNYLGKEIGMLVFNERKQLFAKTSMVKWYIETFDPAEADMLLEYINGIGKKITNRLKEHYSSPAGEITREKLKIRDAYWVPINAKANSERWNDKEWVAIQKENAIKSNRYARAAETHRITMLDPEVKRKFIEACNKPDRIKKISDFSKAQWKRWKLDDNMMYKMHACSRSKNFEVNGIKMNGDEYKLALCLNDIGVKWEFEKIFNIGTKTYFPDFYLPEHSLIIESYGDYWHANPIKYSSADYIFKNKITAHDIWEKDRIRKLDFESIGLKFLAFFRTEVKTNINECKTKIKHLL